MARELLDVRFEAELTLAQQAGGGWLPIDVTVGLALVAAAAALLGRRRLPIGLGECAFVAAVTGVLVLVRVAGMPHGFGHGALGQLLCILAGLWCLFSWAAERQWVLGRHWREAAGVGGETHIRAQVFVCAALISGLAALGAMLIDVGELRTMRAALSAEHTMLWCPVAIMAFFRGGGCVVYPAVALLACMCVLVFPADALAGRAGAWAWGMNLVGLLSLAAVVCTVLADWWRRRRRWLEDPQRLVRSLPAHGVLFGGLVRVSVLVGLAGLLQREAASTPSAVAMAALTCLTVGHVRGWLVVSEIGLVLVGEAIVTASLAWLRPGWSGALLGLGLASGYLLWLARFWDQQLNAGQAWTTAGRLIPVARRLSYVAAAGAVVAAVGSVGSGDHLVQPVWLAGVALLCLLGGMLLFVRDGREHRRIDSALAACMLAFATVGPGCRLLSSLMAAAVSPMVAVAAGASLLALAVAGRQRTLPTAAAYNALIGGALPVTALFTLAWRGLDAQSAVVLVLTAVALLAALLGFRGDSRGAIMGPRDQAPGGR